ISWLALIGSLYGLYLLYLGLPRLMRSTDDKALPFTVVVVLVAILVNLVLSAVVGSVGAMTGPRLGDRGSVSGTVSVPGYGSVDVGKAEAAGRQAERAIASALGEGGSGAVQPIAADRLAALLPGSIAGFTRGDT